MCVSDSERTKKRSLNVQNVPLSIYIYGKRIGSTNMTAVDIGYTGVVLTAWSN